MTRTRRWTLGVVVVCTLELVVAALFGGAVVASIFRPAVLVPIVVVAAVAAVALLAHRRLRATPV